MFSIDDESWNPMSDTEKLTRNHAFLDKAIRNTEPPAAIAELDAFLVSMGGPLRSVAFLSPMSQILIGETATGSVRVGADRGQWFVELAAPGSDDYFDSSVWTACVSDTC